MNGIRTLIAGTGWTLDKRGGGPSDPAGRALGHTTHVAAKDGGTAARRHATGARTGTLIRFSPPTSSPSLLLSVIP